MTDEQEAELNLGFRKLALTLGQLAKSPKSEEMTSIERLKPKAVIFGSPLSSRSLSAMPSFLPLHIALNRPQLSI